MMNFMKKYPHDYRFGMVELVMRYLVNERKVLLVHGSPIDRYTIFNRIGRMLQRGRYPHRRMEGEIHVGDRGLLTSIRGFRMIEYQDIRWRAVFTHKSCLQLVAHPEYDIGMAVASETIALGSEKSLVFVEDERLIKSVRKNWFGKLTLDEFYLKGDNEIWFKNDLAIRFVPRSFHQLMYQEKSFNYVITDHSAWRLM